MKSPSPDRPELIGKQAAENCLERFQLGVKVLHFLPRLPEILLLYTARREELWPNSLPCCRTSLQKLLLKEQYPLTEINVQTAKSPVKLNMNKLLVVLNHGITLSFLMIRGFFGP